MKKTLFIGIVSACMSMSSLAVSEDQATVSEAANQTQLPPKLTGGGKPLLKVNGATTTGNGSTQPIAGGAPQAVSGSPKSVLQFNPKK